MGEFVCLTREGLFRKFPQIKYKRRLHYANKESLIHAFIVDAVLLGSGNFYFLIFA